MATPPYPSADTSIVTPGLQGIVEAGPTLGRIRRPLFPIVTVTSGDYTVGRFDFQINISFNGFVIISLPSVRTWMRADYGGGYPLIIKDVGGFCSETNFIRADPDGADLIDGQLFMDLTNAYAAMTVRPLDNYTGWFVT